MQKNEEDYHAHTSDDRGGYASRIERWRVCDLHALPMTATGRRATDDNRAMRTGMLAAGGIISALAASSCCVLPLLFVSAGISGAWIGSLTALAPYQPIFVGFAAISIMAGFRSVYRHKQATCAGPDCGTPLSRRFTKLALWAGLLVLLVAGTAEWWAKFLA